MSAAPFQTTQWSLVKRANSTDPVVATAAFSDLYEQYRTPILRFLRFVPHVSESDAEDIFQDYFLDLKRRGFFGKAVPESGRLRNFLLKDLDLFLKNRWRKETAKRRGGNLAHVSLDDLSFEIAGETMEPAAAFDHQWAVNLMELAVSRLEQYFADRNKQSVFDAYAPFLSMSENIDHAKLAKQLGIKESYSRVLLSRVREKWKKTLTEEVARTVDSSDLIEEELHRLHSAVDSRSKNRPS